MIPYFLGIDVSKGYADFIMINKSKQVTENNFQLDDTFKGHQQLYCFLSNFFASHAKAVVYAAVESTGGYENNWFEALHKMQHLFKLNVTRLNPCGVNHNSKAGLSRTITDKLSAKYVAEYLIDHPEKARYETIDDYYPIRRKWKFIHSLVKEKVKFLNQLEILMYDANPELLQHCRYEIPQWILRLLQRYPTATDLKQASISKLVEIPYIIEQRARTLIRNAQNSVASATDKLTADTIRLIARKIFELEKDIKQQIKLLASYKAFPELELIKTFDGIGDYTGTGLLIIIGSIVRYETSKKLSSFFGIHPVFKSSGDGISCMRMSKQGSKQGRALLFMIALSAIRRNKLIKDVYWHNRKKGKTKMDAIGVCMHKILRIVYGMLKNNTPFDPDIDRANRIKSVTRANKSATNMKLRRYQSLDESAPISGRQNNKRKEEEKSQDDSIVMNGIKFPPLTLN